MTKIRSKIGIFFELNDQQVMVPQQNKQLLVIVKNIQGITPDTPNILYELLTEVWGHQTAMSLIDKLPYKLYPILTPGEGDVNKRFILIISLIEEISVNGFGYHNNPLRIIRRNDLLTLLRDSKVRCDPLHRQLIKQYCSLSPSN